MPFANIVHDSIYMDQRQSKVIEQRHMTQKFHSHLYGAKQLPTPWPKQPPFPFEDATIWNYISKT